MARRPPARTGVPMAKLDIAAPVEGVEVLEPVAAAPVSETRAEVLLAPPVAEEDSEAEPSEDSSKVLLPHSASRVLSLIHI